MSLLLALQGGTTTHEAQVAFDGVGSLTNGPVNWNLASVAFEGLGSLALSAVNENRASVAFDGSGNLSLSAVNENLASVAFDGVGDLSASAVNQALASVSFDGVGSFDIIAINQALASVSFDGSGDLNVAAQVTNEIPAAQVRTYWAGYIPPKRKRAKKEDSPVVEIAVEKKVVKYIAITQPIIGPSVAPIMGAIKDVTLLIEARAKAIEIQRKIAEVEEEQDIIIILSQL